MMPLSYDANPVAHLKFCLNTSAQEHVKQAMTALQ
jgi:hypothetical protein